MHVRDLVEITGVVALHGPPILASPAPLSQHHLQQYWATSKCRFERWHLALKSLDGCQLDDANQRIALRATLDEIITSEILTRVWTAIVVGHDRQFPSAGDESIARNVLLSHVEVRHRALALLLDASHETRRDAVAINRLRRRIERWTDVLVGGLLGLVDVREFAFDPERAADFAEDLADRRNASPQAWRLMLGSLRRAFLRGLSPIAANPDANARIAASILGCFPEDVFDGTGLPQSLWMMRLQASANDAAGLIEDLLESETRPASPQFAHRTLRRSG